MAETVVTKQPAALGAPGQQSESDSTSQSEDAPGQREVIAGCPPGLEHLAVAHRINIKQRFELLEVLTGFETSNHYVLLNADNQQIYIAGEQSDCLLRCCCGQRRAFDMPLVDNTGTEVARFQRPYRCCGGGCWTCWPRCCLQQLLVTRAGQLLGSVSQDPALCSTSLSIRSAQGGPVLRVRRGCCRCSSGSPCCSCCCPGCREVRFRVTAEEDGREVGVISKKWGGAVKEALTDADSFTVEMQRDLDVRTKAALVGAVFLIDFMFFEDNSGKDKAERGGSSCLLCCCC